MSETAPAAEKSEPRPAPRGLIRVLQPALVRIYRSLGVIALAAILLGLLGYVCVNVFYYFNRTWVRPVLLTEDNGRVIEVTNNLRDARLRRSELAADRAAAVAELANIDRVVQADADFEAYAGKLVAAGPASPERALLSRELDRARLERLAALDRRPAVEARAVDLAKHIAEQDLLVERLARSPFAGLTAGEERVVGFVPYQNLGHVKVGAPLYACRWGIVRCREVGKVVAVLPGELQDTHPHTGRPQRGVMIDLRLSDARIGRVEVLFVGRKPLRWL